MSSSVWRWYGLSVVVILLDQLSKFWITKHFHFGEVLPLVDCLNLTLVYNTGAAFSFLSDAGGWQRWFFAILASGVSVMLVIWLAKLSDRQKLLSLSLALILGGAVGNLWDRMAYGHVIDFIDVYYGAYHWPAFNVADSAITVGAILLVIDNFIPGKETDKQ